MTDRTFSRLHPSRPFQPSSSCLLNHHAATPRAAYSNTLANTWRTLILCGAEKGARQLRFRIWPHVTGDIRCAFLETGSLPAVQSPRLCSRAHVGTEEGHCRARRGNGFRHWFSVNDQELYGIARRAYAGHLCREPVDFGKGLGRGLMLADDRGLSRLIAPVRLHDAIASAAHVAVFRASLLRLIAESGAVSFWVSRRRPDRRAGR